MKLWIIFKKEMSSYYNSLIAYIIIAIFLLIAGYFFYTDLLFFVLWAGIDINIGFWEYYFHDIRYFLILLIPILTMRLFAEEKKLGTIELLTTYPLRDIDILLGKFLACFSILFLMLFIVFFYSFFIKAFHVLNWGPVLSGFFGLLLLGCAFMSCGIFLSSITENQIVAAAMTYCTLLAFWFITWNENIGGETLVKALKKISLFDRFYNFSRGLIDIKNILFFLLFIFFFLFLTYISLESRRWKGLKQ
ncbi:MAG: ABC transporter permease subunit [Thermodesulfobacteriota bacterium]|nr:ABC transporter permease subunit [Thermodesulfobacteriota bacterium]